MDEAQLGKATALATGGRATQADGAGNVPDTCRDLVLGGGGPSGGIAAFALLLPDGPHDCGEHRPTVCLCDGPRRFI